MYDVRATNIPRADLLHREIEIYLYVIYIHFTAIGPDGHPRNMQIWLFSNNAWGFAVYSADIDSPGSSPISIVSILREA